MVTPTSPSGPSGITRAQSSANPPSAEPVRSRLPRPPIPGSFTITVPVLTRRYSSATAARWAGDSAVISIPGGIDDSPRRRRHLALNRLLSAHPAQTWGDTAPTGTGELSRRRISSSSASCRGSTMNPSCSSATGRAEPSQEAGRASASAASPRLNLAVPSAGHPSLSIATRCSTRPLRPESAGAGASRARVAKAAAPSSFSDPWAQHTTTWSSRIREYSSEPSARSRGMVSPLTGRPAARSRRRREASPRTGRCAAVPRAYCRRGRCRWRRRPRRRSSARAPRRA